ncbi:nucleoside monophosphate kinase [Polymorphospora sp. NPDC051019]|uniref:nucleoside monophosphate kinase n=1 Tax=Polymorphospora sp. NPDC051019 TaxID=3155725 RepID=UPI0034187D3F
MRLIILGPPGSGRETVAEVLAADMGVPTITARDTFQSGVRANTPAAVEAMRLMRTGRLVPKRLGLAPTEIAARVLA